MCVCLCSRTITFECAELGPFGLLVHVDTVYVKSESRGLLWPPYVIGQAITFLPCGFYLLSFFSFLLFFPRLISAAADWMSTIYFGTWCGLSANLECMSEMCCTRLAGNTGRKKSPFWHHRTNLSDYIFGTKACIENRKNLLNSNNCPTCPHNMANFGPLTA